ncbi:hypothetical protein SteCoe_19666 [Stentor coeruleus]|uniref:Uncharacterized protein n=1 Tax=Stentor coeruleus TaxID=5963 RepID=A0A1R2BU67_9CILI|nr:hypothetical protein SteCoe_19666 [Stentor coeruleus]
MRPIKKKDELEIIPSLSNLPFLISGGLADNKAYNKIDSGVDGKSNCEELLKGKSSFLEEFEKLGVNAKGILEKNPLKFGDVEGKARFGNGKSGLPFQRRARSSSPPKDNLRVIERSNNHLFAPRSPVVVSHKLKFKNSFSELSNGTRYFFIEEDEDLKNLKEEYRKLLENASHTYSSDSDDIEDEGEIEKIISQFRSKNQLRYF